MLKRISFIALITRGVLTRLLAITHMSGHGSRDARGSVRPRVVTVVSLIKGIVVRQRRGN